MSYVNSFYTDDSLGLVTTDGVKMLRKENPYFPRVVESLRKGKYNQAVELTDLASRLKKVGSFYLENGRICHNSTIMPEGLSNRIVQFADLGISTLPYVRFWENLVQNTCESAREELFLFLENNHIPVTEDGCFICYKRVSEIFFDLWTGKINNSPGQKPKMDRKDSDPDRKNACSRGLHVAAFSYAHDQYSNGNLIEVKVNPRDVVAVPEDHNNEKMRVCEYEVLAQIGEPRKAIIFPKFAVDNLVLVYPDLDRTDCLNGKVLAIIEEEGKEPSYDVLVLATGEIVKFSQSHVHWMDEEDENEDAQEEPDEDSDDDFEDTGDEDENEDEELEVEEEEDDEDDDLA